MIVSKSTQESDCNEIVLKMLNSL